MKTKNNVQKTLLRWAAVFVSLVLISFTVSAQGFWQRLLENSSFGNIAMAMVDTKDTGTGNSYSAFHLETDTESTLALENWMTSESTFSVPATTIARESETVLKPEEWMFDQEIFLPVTEEEPALQIESWMVSEDLWKM